MNKTITRTVIIFSSLTIVVILNAVHRHLKAVDEVRLIKTSDQYGIFFDSYQYPENEDLKRHCERVIKFKTKSQNIAQLCIKEDPRDWDLAEGLPQSDYLITPGSAQYRAFQIMNKYYGKNKPNTKTNK